MISPCGLTNLNSNVGSAFYFSCDLKEQCMLEYKITEEKVTKLLAEVRKDDSLEIGFEGRAGVC